MGGIAVDIDDDDWSGEARYFEYSRAANPVGSGRVPPLPMERFPAGRHRAITTGIVPFDLSEALGTSTPATSPALLAAFIRIAPGDTVETAPVATSELYCVIAGEGSSIIDGRELRWATGDFFVLPANCRTVHRATTDTTLYWVTDEPLLRHLGVAPTEQRFAPTRFPAERLRAELADVEHSPRATDRNRLSVLLNTVPNDMTQTVTHVLWAMYGLVPVGTVQRPHRHQSVALDLVGQCAPGCFTLVGRSIDEDGEIIDPIRVDWEPQSAFVTPPGLWHAHHNESGEPAWIIPIQDAGLHSYLRTLDIRFAPPRRT
ncbi:MAG: cupin domain-containing protein [Acidimicrobiia bacterium]|nr:cupin domain-containing protein [Acidimicrobiia bacterium]